MTVTQINPTQAFELLKNDENSLLVDVRTFEEFHFVGFVVSEDFQNRLALLPWQVFPEMQNNPEFDEGIEDALKNFFGENFKEEKLEELTIIFTCRTGGRSNAAAQHCLNLGYKNCYNLSSGFEGDLDQNSQRGKINGWKAENLPWRQK